MINWPRAKLCPRQRGAMVTKSSPLLSQSRVLVHQPPHTTPCKLCSLDPNPRAKKTMMASSAALLQASTAFAPVLSPLPSRLQPAPCLHLRGSPNRRRRGVALAASSAASPEVEKDPSTSPSSSLQESESVSTENSRGFYACMVELSSYHWVFICFQFSLCGTAM
jgi:hypothetical protein